MATIRPFRGLRPKPELAKKVAAPPYDVINRKEARLLAKDNPDSFLHVNKPEIDLPDDIGLYDEQVYKKGAQNLQALIDRGVLFQDDEPCFYLYKQIMGEHSQIGIVAAASVEEYKKDLIKKHELTRVEKEDDRLSHILSLKAQVGPVFLTYQAKSSIDLLVELRTEQEPDYDFKSDDGIRHTLWVIKDKTTVTQFTNEFKTIPHLYVADGHHRSAAAARACETLKAKNPNHTGEEPYNYFLSVIFPHNQMYIMDYNRVVKDLNGLSVQQFLEAVEEKFLIREIAGDRPYKPITRHDFGMYVDFKWYKISAIPGTWNEADPVDKLDVSILYNNLLRPVLNIGDPRTDKRIDFVGGIRGMDGLQKRVDSGEMQVAFSLHPTSIEELMAIADAGKTMPPKSTWFEPKLRSGLVVHML